MYKQGSGRPAENGRDSHEPTRVRVSAFQLQISRTVKGRSSPRISELKGTLKGTSLIDPFSDEQMKVQRQKSKSFYSMSNVGFFTA